MRRHQERAQRSLDRWYGLQPVLSPKMPSQESEICETNLTDPLCGGSQPDDSTDLPHPLLYTPPHPAQNHATQTGL